MAKPNLIDFLDALTVSGENLLTDEESISAYNIFLVNRGIAQNIDCILFANEMNKRAGISKEMHYNFLNKSLVKKKRYSRWPKKIEQSEDVQAISDYYQVSIEKAEKYLDLLTPEQLTEIKDSLDKGGAKKGRKG